MQKLLILGASILQLPAIIKAKEMGLHVSVIDSNPQAVGIRYANDYHNASTFDVEAVCKIAEKIQPNGVITLASDMPMRSVAAATTLLHLPGISFETAVNATDKGKMIRVFKEQNVEVPWYHIIKNESDLSFILNQLTFPCIVKPTDSSGSRGVILVDTPDEIKNAYSYSRKQSREDCVIIEEYLKGSEVSVEIIVVNGNVNILAVTDKITTGSPHFVEMGHIQQSGLKQDDLSKIKNLAMRAVKAVGIHSGAAHVEIMLTDKGPKMIELGARMGGDYITTHLVPLSTGIDMVMATIDIALGKKPDIIPKFQKGSAILYFDVSEGIISSVEGMEQALKIAGIQEINFTKNLGDTVSLITSSTDRIGFVIAQGENGKDAIRLCKEAMNNIHIEVK